VAQRDPATEWQLLAGRLQWDPVLAARAWASIDSAYHQPHRRYHTVEHLGEMLVVVDALQDRAAEPDAVRLATFFHDETYTPGRDDNERQSAEHARTRLTELGTEPSLTAEVSRLVELTAGHTPGPGDANGAVLCDADLSILGREPSRYERYRSDVRAEYRHLDDRAWQRGRIAVIHGLVGRATIFSTVVGYERFEALARQNLARELAALAPSA
jgi:predicted metal-dependent HD superfamily phosphohydrolase